MATTLMAVLVVCIVIASNNFIEQINADDTSHTKTDITYSAIAYPIDCANECGAKVSPSTLATSFTSDYQTCAEAGCEAADAVSDSAPFKLDPGRSSVCLYIAMPPSAEGFTELAKCCCHWLGSAPPPPPGIPNPYTYTPYGSGSVSSGATKNNPYAWWQ